jgi:HEXXH motif-containing protein
MENRKNKSVITLDGRSERKILLRPAQSSRYLKSKGCGRFPSVRIGAKRLCILLPDEPNNFGFETRSDSPVLRAATKSVERAFDLLEKHAKPYVKWVNRVIREVVALRCSKGFLRSNSSEDWPGKIQLSLPRRPVEVAEMLVHEASHQYFYAVQRFEAVSDADDRKLYYSPVKGTDRPIDKILLAFHAFANVGLFYKSCIATGLDDKNYCKINLERHLQELNELAEHLRSCNSLTKIGRALWEPLANNVF